MWMLLLQGETFHEAVLWWSKNSCGLNSDLCHTREGKANIVTAFDAHRPGYPICLYPLQTDVIVQLSELVATLLGCTASVCDKIKQSAEGAIQAVMKFVMKRGHELNETDVSRTTQSLLTATMLIAEKHLRQEILGVVSFSGKDILTKDISRLRGGWPMQDVFYAFSQHAVLSFSFLEHVVSVLNHIPFVKGDSDGTDNTSHSFDSPIKENVLQAAVLALTALFKGGGKVGKKATEQSYVVVLSALTLQL